MNLNLVKNYFSPKEAIEMLYEKERQESEPADNVKLTLQCSPEHSAMLNLLAKRFEVSKYSLVQPFLEKAVIDMFSSLDFHDKFELALAADLTTGDHKNMAWRDYAKTAYPDEFKKYELDREGGSDNA